MRACFVIAALTALSLGACYHVAGEKQGVDAEHGLGGFADCAGFESYAKSAAEQLLLAEIEALKDSISPESGDMAVGAGEAAPPEGDVDGDTSSADGDFSQTNVQEEGVDEPDLVKNDGDYLYVMHAGELAIVETTAAADLALAGRAEVGGYAEEMFVRGDLAVVFSTLGDQDVPAELELPGEISDQDWECWEWGECGGAARSYTQIALVDVADRANPAVVRTIILGGEYDTARLIDDRLKVVIHSDIPVLHMSWDGVDESMLWGESSNFVETGMLFHDLYSRNMERFAAATLDDIMPRKLDSMDGEVEHLASCDAILGPETPAGIGLTTVVSLDLDSTDGPISTTSVFGKPGLVYATTENLYLTTAREYVQMAALFGVWKEETSGVHKFDIARDDATAYYLATGVVDGRMLNQFCLGEHEGYLRVATTTGDAWESGNLDNHLFVLEENKGALDVVGRLDEIGTGEEIYAARFLGERGFLVTFFQSDPLFTLDLSDPTDPRVVGEWLGPGYSTYLHPVGADQVLAVGMEDWQVSVSLYDVSDLTDPGLVERLYLDDAYTSAAVDDHRAFTFNPETGLLALPFYAWDGETGVLLYDVAEDGIDQTGALSVSTYEDDVGPTLRSAYTGGAIFGVTRCRVASALLDTPAETVDSVELYTASACDDFYGWSEDWGW